jgi:hypothetical protein
MKKKCECGYTMIEKGLSGRTILFSNIDGSNTGSRTEIIYQCPVCKNITIE